MPIDSAILGYINSEFVGTQDGSNFTYIYGMDDVEQSHEAYIQSGDSITDGQGAFIISDDNFSSNPAYISGPITILSTAPAFIMNANPLYGPIKWCYIGSDGGTEAGAIRFDKTLSQRAEWLHVDAYNSEHITVNFWMRPTEAPDSTRGVYLHKQYTTNNYSWGIFEATAGVQKWHYGVTTGGVWGAQNSTGSYVLDTWYMVTLVYDGSNCALYVNGVFDSQFAKTGPLNIDTGTIYAAWYWVDLYTSFDFADFTIWNYAITPSEIAALYVHQKSDSIGAYISNFTAPDVISWQHLYITSPIETTNPGTTTSTQMCCIAFASSEITHTCYLVAGDIIETEHDLEIIIGDFQDQVFDLVIKVGEAQGERTRRFQDGDILYPITRESFRELEGVFFSDNPGRAYGNLDGFVHGGFAIDTHTGDLSNPEDPIVGPNIQLAFISIGEAREGNHQVFLNGSFTAISSSQMAYIAAPPDVFTLAYIEGAVVTEESEHVWCYIGAPFDAVISTTTSFSHGWDIIETTQVSMILAPNSIGGNSQAYIHAEPVSSIDTYNVGLSQFNYMNSHLVLERSHNIFVYGIYVIEPTQDCFITVIRTVEGDQDCFIISPFFFISPGQVMLSWGWEAIIDTQSLFIMSTLNIEDSNPSYIYGYGIFESSKSCFITNFEIVSTGSTQAIYLQAPTIETTSIGCFVAHQAIEQLMNAFIMNLGATDKNKFAYIAGPYLTVSNTSYISGPFIATASISAYVS